MPIIRLETRIKGDLREVFDLSRSVALHEQSTQQTNEKAIAGKTKGYLDLGDEVTWRAKHFGIYQTLSVRITEFQAPHFFVDEMIKGVFKRFRHEHYFETQEGNDVLMTDIFDYTAPLGLLGRLADTLFLEKYMTRFLEKRNEVIKSVAEQS